MERLTKHPLALIAAAGLFFLMLLCTYAFHEGEEAIRAKTERVFKETLKKDLGNKLDKENKSKERFVYEVPSRQRLKSVTYESRPDMQHIILHWERDDSLDGGAAHLVCAVVRDYPRQADSLNVLFKRSLDDAGISTTATGVIHQHYYWKQYSNKDTVSVKSAYLTEEQPVYGFWATAQGWVKFAPTAFVNYIPGWVVVTISIYIALLVGAGICWFIRKEQEKRCRLQAEAEQREADRAAYEKGLFGNTCRFEGMTLYERTRTIHADGIIGTLGKNEFRLLWMFVTAPDHTLHTKDIQDTFWHDSLSAQNSMDVLVSTLRKTLQKFPSYRLCSLKGMKIKLEFFVVGQTNTASK